MFSPVGLVGEFLVSDTESPRPVYVNLNTCTQFQVWYGSSLLSVIPGLLVTLQSMREASPLAMIAGLDLRALHILGAAALHKYRNKEPVFDLTPGELGATLTFEQWAALFRVLIKGIGDFLPKGGDGPPQQEEAEGKDRPTSGGNQEKTHTGTNGSPPSTHSQQDILATLTLDLDEPRSAQSGSDGEPMNSGNVIAISER